MEFSIYSPSLAHREMYSRLGFPVSDSGDRVIWIGDGHPRASDLHVRRSGWLRGDESSSFIRSLHQLGGPFLDLREFVCPVGLSPFVSIYGAGTSRPVLPSGSFHGRGLFIHRDDPQISAAISVDDGIIRWVRPGIPSTPRFSKWSVGGRVVQGVLSSSVDHPGGFVVLEPSDLVQIFGYEPPARTLSPSDLQDLVPSAALSRLFDWFSSALRRNPDAMSVITPSPR